MKLVFLFAAVVIVLLAVQMLRRRLERDAGRARWAQLDQDALSNMKKEEARQRERGHATRDR